MNRNQKYFFMFMSSLISFLIALSTAFSNKITPLAVWLCCMAAFYMGANTLNFIQDWQKAKKRKELEDPRRK